MNIPTPSLGSYQKTTCSVCGKVKTYRELTLRFDGALCVDCSVKNGYTKEDDEQAFWGKCKEV